MADLLSGADGTGQSRKRSSPMSAEEGLRKVKRTVGWFNHNGGLQQPIIYKSVKGQLESIDPRAALKILKGLEEKGSTVRNPTAWINAAAEKAGIELDMKVKKTIVWYNKHGDLQAQISYDEVKVVLASLPVAEALAILKSLQERASTVRDPTSWIYKAAERKLSDWSAAPASQASSAPSSTTQWPSPSSSPWGKASGNSFGKGGVTGQGSDAGSSSAERKLQTTVAWYNDKGGLQQPIDYDQVLVYLAQMDVKDAMLILKGLEERASSILNPTNWIIKAAQLHLGMA